MFKFNYVTEEDTKKIIQIGQKFLIIHNEYGGSGSRKSNALLNLINNEIDKMYSCKRLEWSKS